MTTAKTRRGDGMLYRRGRIWWLKFYQDGDVVRMSAGTADERVARKLLRDQTARVQLNEPLVVRAARTSYDEIRDDLLAYYRATGKRNLAEAGWRLTHLDPAFRAVRASQITAPAIARYVVERQGAGAAAGSINRELGVLGRMLRLAVRHGKLARVPDFADLKPKEAPPRRGFFERDAFEAVRAKLPADLQVAVTLAHTFGWRMQSEVLALELRQVDLEEGTLRLDAGTTKNDHGRVVYLTDELKPLLAAHVARVAALSRDLGRVVLYLFPHFPARFVRRALVGTQRQDFCRAWTSACAAAGYPGMLRHDFRRTAVRNMEQARVPRSVAMKVTGHRTESIYRRYAIVSPDDLKRAAELLTVYRTGTITGTPGPVTPIRRKRKAGQSAS
jgi:integrase